VKRYDDWLSYAMTRGKVERAAAFDEGGFLFNLQKGKRLQF
jgi:hypothetical protein